MQVADIMTNASVTESPDDSLRDAAEKMWKQQTGSLLVMDGDKLVGIITERDILQAAAQGRNIDSTAVGDAMTRDIVTVRSSESIQDAARLMAQHWIRHLPVVEERRLTGIISIGDVVKHKIGQLEFERDQLDGYIHQT